MGKFNYRLYKDEFKVNEHTYERARIIEVYYTDDLEIKGFAEISMETITQYGEEPISKNPTDESTVNLNNMLFTLGSFVACFSRPVLTKADFMHLTEQP